jgi:hypothetical protein
MKIFISLVLLIITALGLYCAAAGWVNADLNAAVKENKTSEVVQPVLAHGLRWVNADALKRYETAYEARQWFPWMVNLPHQVALLITAISFGMIGGVARVGWDAIGKKVDLGIQSLGVVFLSGLAGLVILAVSYVIPAALTISEGTVRPVALFFLCLVGGMFYDHIYSWLKKRLEKLFEI